MRKWAHDETTALSDIKDAALDDNRMVSKKQGIGN
jgi:hypothetical protein